MLRFGTGNFANVFVNRNPIWQRKNQDGAAVGRPLQSVSRVHPCGDLWLRLEFIRDNVPNAYPFLASLRVGKKGQKVAVRRPRWHPAVTLAIGQTSRLMSHHASQIDVTALADSGYSRSKVIVRDVTLTIAPDGIGQLCAVRRKHHR